MKKKFITLGIAFLMLFSLAACLPEDDDMRIQLMQGFYNTDDNVYSIRLYDENQFSFHISYISHLPTGTYKIEGNRLTLDFAGEGELYFEIEDSQLKFVGASKDGLFGEEFMENGKVFKKAFAEVEVGDMVKLHTWIFTSGVPNNAIVFKHTDENAEFECVVDKGQFGFNTGSPKTIIAKSGDTVHWSHNELVEQAFVRIIVRIDDKIVGYAVIHILMNNGPADHTASILKSAEIPKADAEFATTEQIQTIINQIIKNNGGNSHEN